MPGGTEDIGQDPAPTRDQLPRGLVVTDPVWFRWKGRRTTGHIVRKNSKDCLVVTDQRGTLSVPQSMLHLRTGATRKRVFPPVEEAKIRFQIGDQVWFRCREGKLSGTLIRMNPKRAKVSCSDGDTWNVPYQSLVRTSPSRDGDPTKVLRAVAAKAESLMARHSLVGWSFQFDDALKRAGQCRYSTKVLSMAHQYCLQTTEREWTDTILHEIAHAMVGPGHHHDDVWKRTARAIGCKAERCHSVEFTPPRYILSCRRCNWAVTRQRRKRGLICSQCKTAVEYADYTPERWARAQERNRQQSRAS